MADENDRPTDEFGEPIPTQAQLETERAKQEELRRAAEEAAALEAQLPSSTPLSLPVSSGRMYMGPSMTPEQETAFRASPSLPSQILVPPPTQESSAGAAARVAAMTAPPTISAAAGAPSPTSIYPEMRQFYAQQQIRKAVESGVPINQAMQLYGQEFFARSAKPITPIEQARLDASARREKGIQSRFDVAEKRRLGQPTIGETSEYRRSLASMRSAESELLKMTPEDQQDNPGKVSLLVEERNKAYDVVAPYERKFGRQPTETITRPATTISPPSMTPAATGPVKITSKAQRDALPRGSVYIGPDGKRYVKA